MLISIIVPVYNEKENLPILIEKICSIMGSTGKEWEVILVNDGSTDGSTETIDSMAGADKRVKAVHFRRNFGQTAAIMAGIDYSKGDIIIPMDADLQNDPADIPALLATLDEGNDVVSGWRKERKDASIKRILPSKIANGLISLISGVKLHDYGCTLKAYRRDVIKDIKLYGEMHRFIPIYAHWQGAKVAELPVAHNARIHGKSNYGIERTIKVVLDLIVIKFLERYSQKPIYVFGSFGLMSFIASFGTFAAMIYYKFWGGKTFIQTPLPVLAAVLVLIGFLSIFMGLIAEMVNRTYYESQHKTIYSVKNTKNIPPDACGS